VAGCGAGTTGASTGVADWARAPRAGTTLASAAARTTKARGPGDGKSDDTGLYYGQSCWLSAIGRRPRSIIMITITNLAAEKVKEISQAEGLAGQGLRLRVIGGGCAGFQYDLYFEEKPTDMDERFESNGVALFVDPLSYQYLDQTEIDYVESAHGSGFKFQNPNVTSTCGCGSSFKA
jgi:iron-sulfur cluster insertion protein